MTYQRINKTLSHFGVCSRRKAEILIRSKKVFINGELASLGSKVNPKVDKIKINGIELKTNFYHSKLLLLNKPKRVITSCSDNRNRKTILDLLPNKYKKGFYPIGRLDYMSRGALLITNNGDLCYRLSHPKFNHEKTYIVKIKGILDEKSINMWRSGLYLNNIKTKPCKVNILEKNSEITIIKIIMLEGRNRQIRRIADKIGLKVLDLKRISFGNFSINNLKEGSWRIIESSRFEALS